MAYAFFLLPLHIGLLRGANKAEAVDAAAVEPVVRAVAVSVGNSAPVRVAVPKTTTQTATRTGRHT